MMLAWNNDFVSILLDVSMPVFYSMFCLVRKAIPPVMITRFKYRLLVTCVQQDRESHFFAVLLRLVLFMDFVLGLPIFDYSSVRPVGSRVLVALALDTSFLPIM
jgi:hypothetical protein